MTLRLLEHDPDLGARLTEDEFALACHHVVVPSERVPIGPFAPVLDPLAPGSLGFLVLSGYIYGRFAIGAQPHLEIIGPGDVIRPWVEQGPVVSVPQEVNWGVLQPAQLALLDARFTRHGARWPQLTAAVLNRAAMRSRRLNFMLAANSLRRTDDRILVVLWSFAESWGRVTADGVTLPLPLTHQQLAEIVGAERPSVTTALGQLKSSERIVHREDRTWVLPGEPPQSLNDLRTPAALTM